MSTVRHGSCTECQRGGGCVGAAQGGLCTFVGTCTECRSFRTCDGSVVGGPCSPEDDPTSTTLTEDPGREESRRQWLVDHVAAAAASGNISRGIAALDEAARATTTHCAAGHLLESLPITEEVAGSNAPSGTAALKEVPRAAATYNTVGHTYEPPAISEEVAIAPEEPDQGVNHANDGASEPIVDIHVVTVDPTGTDLGRIADERAERRGRRYEALLQRYNRDLNRDLGERWRPRDPSEAESRAVPTNEVPTDGKSIPSFRGCSGGMPCCTRGDFRSGSGGLSC